MRKRNEAWQRSDYHRWDDCTQPKITPPPWTDTDTDDKDNTHEQSNIFGFGGRDRHRQ